MLTVQVQLQLGGTDPTLCDQFEWCVSQTFGHTVHQSVPVALCDGRERLLFAESCPVSGAVVYGPVLSGGSADVQASRARVLAAELRVAASALELLAVSAG